MTETIHQALRRLIEEGATAEVAADKVLHEVPKSRLIEFVKPSVLNLATRIERTRVRSIENAAFARPPAVHPAAPTPLPPGGGTRLTTAEARRKLVVETFPLPDGRTVAWGKASAKDHLARAEWQRGRAASTNKDAARHEAAAALIAKHKATCLDDIAGWGDLIGDAA